MKSMMPDCSPYKRHREPRKPFYAPLFGAVTYALLLVEKRDSHYKNVVTCIAFAKNLKHSVLAGKPLKAEKRSTNPTHVL